MRQAAGAGLFVFFVLTLVGVYPAQWALRQMARRDMKEMLRAGGSRVEGLAELSFKLMQGEVADAGFTWEEQGEFSFNDRLYDVIDSRRVGDVVTFLCIPDEREDALVDCARRLDPSRPADRTGTDGAPLMLKLVVDHFIPPTGHLGTPREPVSIPFVTEGPALLLAGFEQVALRPPTA